MIRNVLPFTKGVIMIKNLQDLQDCVRFKDKLHIIIDEEVIKSLNSSYSEDLFSPIYKRIFENFAKKEKINITVLLNKKIKGFSKSEIHFVLKTKFVPEELLENTEYRNIYIGYEKAYLKLFKKIVTVGVGITDEKLRKQYKILVSRGQFELFLTETNNLYL